ncbi:MAG: GNAT family N-acetyltransferase [Terracidiphilus sp.]
MDFSIRKAVGGDVWDIARVQVESWRTTYAGIVPAAFLSALSVEQRAERWREVFAESEMTLYVAEGQIADGQVGIFGFASGGKLREPIGDYDAELFAIYLLRAHQGKGAGRRLFETLAQTLRAAGHAAMAVWVLRENPAALFYQHMGGVEIAHKQIEIGGILLEEVAYGVSLTADRDVVN